MKNESVTLCNGPKEVAICETTSERMTLWQENEKSDFNCVSIWKLTEEPSDRAVKIKLFHKQIVILVNHSNLIPDVQCIHCHIRYSLFAWNNRNSIWFKILGRVWKSIKLAPRSSSFVLLLPANKLELLCVQALFEMLKWRLLFIWLNQKSLPYSYTRVKSRKKNNVITNRKKNNFIGCETTEIGKIDTRSIWLESG